MTPFRFSTFLRTVVIHGRRDIRHAVHHLRHNGALLTFIVFLAAAMWLAGAYMHRNPLVMQTMETRAGCDVGAKQGQALPAICTNAK